MRHVATNHHETFFAHLSEAASILGAGVHRHGFTNIAVRANNKPRRAAAVFHRLRWRSQRGKWINHRTRADLRVAGQMNVSD